MQRPASEGKTIAVISGQSSYRGIGSFIKSNGQELIRLMYLPKPRLPSYSTVRRVLKELPSATLSQILSKWQRHFSSSAEEYDWVHIDGKAIKATVENAFTSAQDFIEVGSFYYSPQKLTLAADGFNSKQKGEEEVVPELIKELGIEGSILTADALHAKKRPFSRYGKTNSTTCLK